MIDDAVSKVAELAKGIRDTLPVKPVGATRLLIASDIHLGHKRTPTEHIIDTLDIYVSNPRVLADVDAVIIPGDLFDKLLSYSSMDARRATKWVLHFLHVAKATNTAIRVLEGTPSHDWEQSGYVDLLNTNANIMADVQYITELSIVEDKTLGLTFGYVPDEWRESHEQTTLEMKELMATRGFSQLDLMFMHGLFEFQIPKVKIPAFNADEWLSMVRYGIFIGHDHNHKSYKEITIPGSIERTVHGEEGNKGVVIADIKDGVMQNHFIVNENAMEYVTKDLLDLEFMDAITTVESFLEKVNRKCKLRIRVPSGHELQPKINEWKADYPMVDFTIEVVNPNSKDVDTEESVFALEGASININPENIEGMILRELENSDICHQGVVQEISIVREMI